METIGVRELQQRASAVLRRIERGEVLGVTDRGRLVAVMQPPSAAGGAAGLIASGRVRLARRRDNWLPAAVAGQEPSQDVLDELRADRD
jgi:antitoxin (DNA-binding transcriptional repressor) of toxin-antitoxin stability system